MKNPATKQSKKRLMAISISLIALFIVAILVYRICNIKLTYLEYTTLNSEADTYVHITNNGQIISQEFVMPYDIFHGISIKIGTFARDNNSIWRISVVEDGTDKTIVEKDFNASLITNKQFHLYSFGKNYSVNKGEKYRLVITPVKVSDVTSLAFYRSDNSRIEEAELYVGEEKMDGDLCIAVYGGDKDLWWIGFSLLIFIYLAAMVLRGIIAFRAKKIWQDKIFMSMVCAAIVFLLLFSFAVSESFTDETDNLRGGMIIANGGVLYRDYVTQHTPVMYYLCGLFALLGAGSIQQFRLSYYLLEAIAWGLLYYRHSELIGKLRMLFLAILETVFISSIISPQGYQVLSDGLQGFLFVALLLEFIGYYRDNNLGWRRSAVISCCIWGSFGAVFISAYALVWIFIAVFFLEIVHHIKNKTTIKGMIQRYYRLFVSVLIPFICAVVYFKANHSLRRAFDQFYSFNREVYSQYIGGMGENIAQPFINAYKNFFNIIANNFNSIIIAQATNVVILQLFVSVAAIVVIIRMAVRKRYTESFLLFNVMCCSATRGFGFHGLAAWYVAIFIMVTFSDFSIKNKSIYYPVIGVTGIILFSTYVNAVADNLLYKQTAVSKIDNYIIDITEDGEKILIDAWCDDSLYLCFKDRYPANRVVYMLPWYMDWYEQDTIDDLLYYTPKLVVFNENSQTWKYENYANAFLQELKANYTRVSDNPDDGWPYYIWMRQ